MSPRSILLYRAADHFRGELRYLIRINHENVTKYAKGVLLSTANREDWKVVHVEAENYIENAAKRKKNQVQISSLII